MDFPLSFPKGALAAIFALLVFIYFLSKTTKNLKTKSRKTKSVPEAAGAWPLVGHLPSLGGRGQLLHKTLGAMADKAGPIFAIKLGVHPAVVVSDWELAKECFTTHDLVFSNRPKIVAIELFGYDYANFGFGSYGAFWRQLRKIMVVELLSNRRLESLGHVRKSEVKSSIGGLYHKCIENKKSNGSAEVLVDMKKWFSDLTLNIILVIVTGKRIGGEEGEEIHRFQAAMGEVFEFMGMFFVSDALPFLRPLDLGGHEKAMRKLAKELDGILQKWLDEHKQRRISGVVKEDKDFMDVLLSSLASAAAAEDRSYDADTIIKANALGTLLGGTDTTTVTLTWALSLLLNNRHVLKKAQEELDHYVGKERRVEDSDLKNLVYLQAIIKETFRLYPSAPLLGPRESMEDCTLSGGYHIPKGTRLVINASKIQRDPRIYSNPNEFRPERYLTEHKDIDVRGQDFELIPFGCGRRICAGISLAMQVLQFTLATLLQGFELTTVSNEPIDMSESAGLSNLKATPLDVLLTPRLPSSCYE